MIKARLAALVLALNLAFVDQLVKEIAVVRLKPVAAIRIVPGWFDLAYVENRGCAWGMLQGQVWPLAAFGLLALAFLVWKQRKIFGEGVLVPAMLYAGIAGNLIDRIFRGCVVDMFDCHWGVHHFPCFNVADALISVAAALMLLHEARSLYLGRTHGQR